MSGPDSPARKPNSKSANTTKPQSKQTTLAFTKLASSSSSSSSAGSSKTKTMKPLGKLTQFSFAVPEVPAHRRQPASASTGSSSTSSQARPSQPKQSSSSTTTNGKSKRKSSDSDSDDARASVIKGKGKGNRAAPGGKGKQRDTDEDERIDEPGLWTDRYAPLSPADLAVNKTKIAEVRAWLDEAVPLPDPSRPRSKLLKYRRILALSGPSGVGKTATVRALCEEMGVEVVEWVEGNEEGGIGGDFGAVSLISRFTTFLSRASSTASLSFSSSSSSTSSTRKLLLLDDLPNLSHPSTRLAFQEALLSFATSWTPNACPIVVIVTDPGDGGRAGESWMDRRRGDGWDLRSVLGMELTDGAYTRAISFNPIAPTFLSKALTRALSLAIPTASQRPPKEALDLIVHSANGDIRSAVNALEFLCKLRVTNNGPKGKAVERPKTGKGSRGGKGGKSSAGEGLKKLMESVTRREQSLALFHALGRVLYNKRYGDPSDDEPEPRLPAGLIPLPAHLEERERRTSKLDVEALFLDAPVDTSLFSLYLHQNYPLFCDDVDECFESVEALSGSDAWRGEEDLWQSSPLSITYAFNLTVRGLLAALPSPITKRGQKMYKPDWFASQKQQRENELAVGEVARWCAREGLGGGSGGGHLPTSVLSTQIIPQVRYLAIPPSYPASLVHLSSLPYQPAAMTRSMRSILGAGEVADDDEQVGIDEDRVPIGPGMGSFYTEREEAVEVGGEGGEDEHEEGEDEVEEWSD